MTIRAMIDTDTPGALTQRADLLATYADLVRTPADLAALEAQWPVVVLIERGLGDPLGRASVLDVELHAEGVAAVPGWYDAKHAARVNFLTVYCDRNTLAAVNHAAGGRGIYRWVATLDGTAHVNGYPAGHAPAAVQCLNDAMLGFHADLSLVFEDSWNPQPGGLGPGGRAALAKAGADMQSAIDLIRGIR